MPSSPPLRVVKYHALGNSYLILDPRQCEPQSGWLDRTSSVTRPAPRLVERLCDMCRGIGSNGLLFGPLPAAGDGEFGLMIVNSDGTRAGFSGNGTRIFAQYLLDTCDIQAGQSFAFRIYEDDAAEAPSNLVRGRSTGDADGRINITAPHAPRFGPVAVAASAARPFERTDSKDPIRYRVPALAEIGTNVTGSPAAWTNSVLVEIGNPHCVTLVTRKEHLPTGADLNAAHGALREIAFRNVLPTPLFERGINLQWAYPESRSRLRAMIYERGEGPTPASGSSASAVACAAFACGMVDNRVEVAMPGGSLDLRIKGSPDDIRSITLSGFATKILDSQFNLDSLQQ